MQEPHSELVNTVVESVSLWSQARLKNTSLTGLSGFMLVSTETEPVIPVGI